MATLVKLRELTADERTELERLARSRTEEARLVVRAKIVLGLAAGGATGRSDHLAWPPYQASGDPPAGPSGEDVRQHLRRDLALVGELARLHRLALR